MRLSVIVLLWTVGLFNAFCQTYSIRGKVMDETNNERLASATVSLFPIEKHLQADKNGEFAFSDLAPATYRLQIRFVGYADYTTTVSLQNDTSIEVKLHPDTHRLSEVVVSATPRGIPIPLIESISVQEIGRTYLLQNNSTNFVQTLASLPGVASMDIGAGFSKPVIRGMAFNRVAVVDKGIVMQNQQWGADHGLEIDQYDVDQVRVHKGPLSLLYGSDAIGGVIEVLPVSIPQDDMRWGDVSLIGKSNNLLWGVSAMTSGKRNRWFYRARLTTQNYADYGIPTDTITYLTWNMPIHNRRMKNTAGREYNASLSLRYEGRNASSWLHISNVYGKNGFFPGAHGIPIMSRLEPDGSLRNVEMPYAFSNHFKVINNTVIQFPSAKWMIDAGFQQNNRKEISQFHTHYSNQKPPLSEPDTELAFLLNTYSLNTRFAWDEDNKWTKTVGVTSEYQQNRVGGYSFLLPAFNRFVVGVFAVNSFKVNDRFTLTGGLRYDVGKLNVTAFFDPVLEQYLQIQQYSPEDIAFYAQRADELHEAFHDVSGSIGVSFAPNRLHSFKMNIGKSFRYPSANELAANGVHHGAFRHEKGNSLLRSESGYQWDMEYVYKGEKFLCKVNPFVTYFTNYIYLNPTGEWSILPHTGQIYEYQQAKALMAGGELVAEYRLNDAWSVMSDLEYIYTKNLTDKYPLPFSPPTVWSTHIAYSGSGQKALRFYMLRLENRRIFAQNHIARNEQRTKGANLIDASLHFHWDVHGKDFMTDVRVQNIFDTPFLNHLSFYRKLNAPEPGRNIQFILKIPF